MRVIWETAPAKVNLALHVVGQRDDGYHLLDSLVVFCTVGDRIKVTPDDGFHLDITGPFGADLSVDPDNLVLKAAHGLRRLLGDAVMGQGARILLEKNLPVSSGIGGGSADAAATLRALLKLWEVSPLSGDVMPLALSLGADVPVCLSSRSVFMAGIGESLTPVADMPSIPAVLVNPGVAVSTPAVFKALRIKQNPPINNRHWSDEGTFFRALTAMRNDLEAPAIEAQPVIGAVKAALLEKPGCHVARMSGSGATVFGLFETQAQAETAAQEIGDQRGWWAVATMIGADKEL